MYISNVFIFFSLKFCIPLGRRLLSEDFEYKQLGGRFEYYGYEHTVFSEEESCVEADTEWSAVEHIAEEEDWEWG